MPDGDAHWVHAVVDEAHGVVYETAPVLLHDVIRSAAADRPDGVAVVDGTRRVSFVQLERRVAVLADMVGQVAEPGDRVLVLADNSLDVVTALYALPRAGALATFGNTRHVSSEIADLAASTRPGLVLADPAMLERHHRALGGAVPGAPLWSLDGEHDRAERQVTSELDDVLAVDGPLTGSPHGARGSSADRRHVASAGDPAWLIHTSGTTGRPKGALLTHRSLLAAVLNTAIARPLGDEDVYLFPFPLFHVAAYNVVHAHLRRRPVVLMSRFDAGELIEVVRREQVSVCSLAPTMLSMLLDHPDRGAADLDSLRQISYGASAMSRDLLVRVHDELPGCGLAQGYGMTELSGNAVFLGPADHRRALREAPHLLAAAGRPGPLVSVRVVDADGADVEPGGAGEIAVGGDQVFAGYRDDPASTDAVLSDGWLRTGDVGRIDDEGYLYVVDRTKDLVISGGENVSSREVEDLLSTHPAVGDVAVVGEADPRWGERVVAVLTVARGHTLDPDELVAWSDGRIAGFKRPRRVVVVESLPTNASGKVDKVSLRRLVAAHPGPSSGAS